MGSQGAAQCSLRGCRGASLQGSGNPLGGVTYGLFKGYTNIQLLDVSLAEASKQPWSSHLSEAGTRQGRTVVSVVAGCVSRETAIEPECGVRVQRLSPD